HRHGEIGTAANIAPGSAHLLRQRKAEMPGLVSHAPRLAQQILPLMPGKPALVPIRACMLAAVVEETDIVVPLLQRPDLGLDEAVQLGEIVDESLRQIEVHCSLSGVSSPDTLQ